MPRRDHSDLTVAIIHFQTPGLLERCVESVRRAAPLARVLVIDTSEREPLGDGWQERHPGAELKRQVNHSYAAAVNRGLAECATPRFVQMNADVFVEETTFDVLAQALEASGAAMVGPLARDGNGRLQRNGLPYRITQYLARRGGWTEAPWLSGFLQYARTDALRRVGPMDTSLRFYNEDLEWCLRLRRAGETCVLVDHEVIHVGGASTAGSPAQLVEGLRGAYAVSVEHRHPLVSAVHRWGMYLYSRAMSSYGSPETRPAFTYLAEMLRRDQLRSPFAETLGKLAPDFPAVPPAPKGESSSIPG